MNPSPHQHHELLQELFEGPREEAIVHAVREAKAARRRRRGMVATAIPLLAAVAWGVASLPWNDQPQLVATAPQAESPVTAPTPSQEAPAFRVEHINDAQLLELLEGQPLALVHLPSGEQRLLMVIDSAVEDTSPARGQ